MLYTVLPTLVLPSYAVANKIFDMESVAPAVWVLYTITVSEVSKSIFLYPRVVDQDL